MRLWSLHPKYLDAQGLVALWREGLLALKVLQGYTKGYTRHPQLNRFRATPDPVAQMRAYLHAVCDEADARGYRFAREKLGPCAPCALMDVTDGQIAFETPHLLAKLQIRDPDRAKSFAAVAIPDLHPLFRVVPGPPTDEAAPR